VTGPQIAKPSFRAPAYKMPEHPPVYPIVAWAESEGGLRTDAMPATATFVSERGLFFTARHVIELADDPAALRVFFHNTEKFFPQPFIWLTHDTLDVAVGLVGVPKGTLETRLVIGIDEVECGEEIWTIGYGEYVAVEHEGATPDSRGLTLNLWPALRKGTLLDVLPGGAPMTRGPAYAHSAYTPGGNSGGPLIRASTQTLHGICSTGTGADNLADAYGVATDIRAILDWPLPFFAGDTLRDLAARGIVSLRSAAPSHVK
jgi:hypothetical protein